MICQLTHSVVFPQITQIDADFITKGPEPYLRYLRHLRAKWDVWWYENRESRIVISAKR